MSVPEGWTHSGQVEDMLRLTKQGANLLFFPPSESPQSAADMVQENAKAFGEDGAASVQIGKPRDFGTSSGLDASSVVVIDHGHVTMLAAFSDGSSTALVQADMPQEIWQNLEDEVDTMLASVEFPTGGGS